MRRILLFATILLCSFHYLEAQYTVNETFDGTSIPAGWTYASFDRTTAVPCTGAGALRRNFWSSGSAGNVQSPSQNSNGQDLTISFKYKILQYSSSTPTVATPNTPDWGDLFVEVSTDGGTTYPIAAGTINNTNHTVSTSCATVSYVVPAASVPNGNSLRVRLRGVWQSGSGTDYFFYIDDFSATQPSVTPPSCATTPAPADAATNQSQFVQLGWAAVAGATSYDVYFGTSPTPPFVGNVTTTSYNPGTLAATTTYYWQVIPKNANGDATGCAAWSFTTLTPPGCGDTWYDTGGPSGNYANNENYTTVICPTVPGEVVTINFTSIGLETCCDNLGIYNGTGTGSPLNTDLTAPASFTSTAGDGCITVTFSSDVSVTGAGWVASITCAAPPAIPNCATALTAPTDGATGVVRNTPLTWTAPTGGGTPTGYKVYLGTSPNPALVTTVTGLTYTPSGQAFNTTYYWRIVPTNATGDAVGCTTEFSYTTEMPPVGTVCGNPIVVGALPYTTTDNTSNYGDDYGTADRPPLTGAQVTNGTGSADYLTGDDVVYAFTPATSGTYNVDLSGVGTWVGLWMFEGCSPFTSTVGYHTSSSAGTRSLPDLVLTGGETYYIVISTFSTPQSTAYTLTITEPSCTNPTATYTVVNDCANSGGFLIDVNVTSLGSATSVSISDGTNTETSAGTGITQMGPYTNGNNITIIVTNEQDGTCFISSSALTQVSCPPVNDDCAGAIDLNPSAQASGSVSATTAGATNDYSGPCNGGNTSPDIFYYINVPDGYTLVIGQTVNSYDSEIYLGYGGACPGTTQIACYDDPDVQNTTWLNNTGNTQQVWWVQDGYFDATNFGTFTLAWTLTAPPSCSPPTAPTATNITATTADVSWTAPASAPSGGYQWAVTTSITPPASGTAETGTSAAAMGLLSNTTYYLHVRSDCDGDGFSDWATQSFTTLTAGATCALAIDVSPGTYNAAPNSGNGAVNTCTYTGATNARWYTFTPNEDGTITVKSCDQTDTRLSILTGNCGSLTCVGNNDDDNDTTCEPDGYASSVVDLAVTEGTTYYIQWDDRWDDTNFDWTLTFTPAPECGANSVYLETANGTYSLDDPCDDGNGWTYYSAPGTPGDYMFAIEWDPNNTGANATAKTNATVTINIQSMISATNGSISASYGMGRYWNVDLNGSSMNGLVNVKFFYDPLEKTAVETAASTFATTNDVPNNGFSWFKTQSAEFTPADITASDFQSSMVLLTEDGSGMENGVHYVQFNDISSFSGGTGATGAGAGFLPVELLAFRGNAMDAGNKLSWETAAEQNAARFVIERSADGHSRWQDVGTVAATGNAQTTQQYSFMDDKPLVSAYYRLRMIDQDNTFAYSPIIQLQRHSKDAALTVFPVPAQDEVQVSFYLAQAGPVAIRVYDLTGKLVSQTTVNLAGGLQQERLDVSSLTSGVYLLNVEADGQRYVERLIKQ